MQKSFKIHCLEPVKFRVSNESDAAGPESLCLFDLLRVVKVLECDFLFQLSLQNLGSGQQGSLGWEGIYKFKSCLFLINPDMTTDTGHAITIWQNHTGK